MSQGRLLAAGLHSAYRCMLSLHAEKEVVSEAEGADSARALYLSSRRGVGE